MGELRFAGCGATALADGKAVAEIYMHEDGSVEASACDIEYAPLLHELLDGIESALVAVPPCALDEELFEEFIRSVGVRCFPDGEERAGFDVWSALGERGVKDRSESVLDLDGDLFEGVDFSNTRELGALGEAIAVKYLGDRGVEIVGRNVRTAYGEADIVCKDRGDTVLVEVKTRMGTETTPEESVDDRKMRRYRNMLLDYLRNNENDCNVRFDVIAVNVKHAHLAHIRHFQGILGWEG